MHVLVENAKASIVANQKKKSKKNLRKHFESVDYCLIILFLPFGDNCSYTVSLNKHIYYLEQRLNVISQFSKSAPNFFLMPLDFSQWGQKLPPKKYINFLPWLQRWEVTKYKYFVTVLK